MIVPDNSFTKGRHNSLEFDIKCIKHTTIMPPKRDNRIQIPKRHGSYKQGGVQRYYDDRVLSLECVLQKEKTEDEMLNIIFWLSQPDDRIFVWDMPSKYYIGELYNGNEIIEYQKQKMRKWTLDFNCDPFKYAEDPKQNILSVGENSINYQGTVENNAIMIFKNLSSNTVTNLTVTAIKKRG